MAIIKYKTERWGVGIEWLEVSRETDKCIWYRRRPNAKADSKELKGANIHDSWAEAREYLVNRATAKVEQCERGLRAAQDTLRRAMALPTTEPPAEDAVLIPGPGELRL